MGKRNGRFKSTVRIQSLTMVSVPVAPPQTLVLLASEVPAIFEVRPQTLCFLLATDVPGGKEPVGPGGPKLRNVQVCSGCSGCSGYMPYISSIFLFN